MNRWIQWILIRSSMKRKKGNFFAILFLVAIVSLALSTCLGIGNGAKEKVNEVLKQSNSADLTAFVNRENLTPDLLQSIRKCESVKEVAVKDRIWMKYKNVTIARNKPSGNVFLGKYEKQKHSYQMYNDEGTTLSKEEMQKPKKGEIYLPIALKDVCHCKIGDDFVFEDGTGKVTLTVKKFYQEPVVGFSMVGIKLMQVSDEDYDQILKMQSESCRDYTFVEVYAADNYKNKQVDMKKDISEHTELVSLSFMTLLKSQSINYTLMFVNIVNAILIAFGVLLFIVTLIVIGNIVNSNVESEYKNYGILKTQGLTSNQIALSLIGEYLLAGLFGGVIGMIGSVFAIRAISLIYIPIIGVLIGGEIYLQITIGIMIAILVLIGAYCYLKTRKIRKISPVQAIANGMPPVHFVKRSDISLTRFKRTNLTCVLAWKEMVSGLRHFISTMLIIALLTMFVTSVTSVEQMSYAENVVDIFGGYNSDIAISYNDDTEKNVEEAEGLIQKKLGIEQQFHITNTYMQLNGNELMCTVADNLKPVQGTLEGRKPKADNEIMLTRMAADDFGMKLGDTVTLKGKTEREVTIVGMYQSTSDAGISATMTYDCCMKVMPKFKYTTVEFLVKNQQKVPAVVKELNEKYKDFGDDFLFLDQIKAEKENTESLIMTIKIITVFTFTLAVVFAMVIGMMICQKTFRREIKDFGTYKSIGYGNTKLRLKFTLKYVFVVLCGVILGVLLNMVFNDSMVCAMLGTMGISQFETHYTAKLLFLPGGILILSSVVFAWISSRKIKKVSSKLLIME